MEPLTVTIDDAKKAIGIGTTKIYELINTGHLKTVKLGRRTLVKTDSIHELVRSLSEARLPAISNRSAWRPRRWKQPS